MGNGFANISPGAFEGLEALAVSTDAAIPYNHVLIATWRYSVPCVYIYMYTY